MPKSILPTNAAVLYLRMSDDRQERSIGDQRSELTAYAGKHGYRILREYVDPGISGDDTRRRIEFLRMREDAAKGEFSVVLCWDQDRFGRFDPIEGGHWIFPFRNAGVRLETIAQGKIDWNDFAGRLIYMVQQEGKHAYLRDLSRNVVRGSLAAAKEGRGTGGRSPKGYKLVGGEVVIDEVWAAIVRRIFTEYLKPGVGLRTVAENLNRENVRSSRGGLWSVTTIRDVLVNQKYAGTFVWGTHSTGRYHTVKDGEIISRKKTDGWKPGTPIVYRNRFEGIIDFPTFEKAQQKLALQQKRTAPKSKQQYVLSGLLYCCDCGTKMTGKQGYHVCRTYYQKGASACHANHIREQDLIDCVCRVIQRDYLSEKAIKQLLDAYGKRLAARRRIAPANNDRLRKQVETLDQQINQGAKRVVSAPDSLVDTIYAEIDRLRLERDRLQAQLNAAGQSETGSSTMEAQKIEEARRVLRDLRAALKGASREDLREYLHTLVARIDMTFTHHRAGKLTRNVFESGKIHIRPDRAESHLLETGRRCSARRRV